MHLEFLAAVPTTWEKLKKVKNNTHKEAERAAERILLELGLVSTDFEVSSNQPFLQFHCKN